MNWYCIAICHTKQFFVIMFRRCWLGYPEKRKECYEPIEDEE